ncbi:MAG TPA: hypothetical protein VD930_02225, partial [Gemmatimonadales bacterium]|nr:hypothetical protein [Gemmatimonadales bacterium]
MKKLRWLPQNLLAGAMVVGWMAPVSAVSQDSTATSLRIATDPPLLTEGSLGWLTVQPVGSDSVVGGEAGGEAIHFERRND